MNSTSLFIALFFIAKILNAFVHLLCSGCEVKIETFDSDVGKFISQNMMLLFTELYIIFIYLKHSKDAQN